MDGLDGDLVAIRQMNPFEGSVTFSQSINSFICEIINSDEAYSSKFRQSCEFENRHVRQMCTVCRTTLDC